MKKFFIVILLYSILLVSSVYSNELPQLNISIDERITQEITYNPLYDSHSDYNPDWITESQNQSNYNPNGKIIIENVNSDWTDSSLGDIFIEIDDTYYIESIDSENSEVSINQQGDSILIYIPLLNPNENITIDYNIDPSIIEPPISIETDYSQDRILPGETITVYDTVESNFEGNQYHDNCIYDLQLTHNAINNNDNHPTYEFSFTGNIDGNHDTYANLIDDYTLLFDLSNEGCIENEDIFDLNYELESPDNISETSSYNFVETEIEYLINSTISDINVIDVKAKSEGIDFNLSQEVIGFTNESDINDENVSWEVTSNIFTQLESISYNLSEVTMWVSEPENEIETDIQSIDHDSVSNELLEVKYNWSGMYTESSINEDCSIDQILTSENPFSSSNNNDCIWSFNYSYNPSPIVFLEFDFELLVNNYLLREGTGDTESAQIQTHYETKNGEDLFHRQIFMILDYWLSLEKNVTSIGNDTYLIEVWVKNRGNQWTPINSPVSIFDYLPSDFELVTNLTDTQNQSIYSDTLSNVYTTEYDNFSITTDGDFQGEMLKWSLNYNNNDYNINSSLSPGDDTGWDDFDSTWYTRYKVRGEGDYESRELYITGLDPELVEGASSDRYIEFSSGIETLRNEEILFLLAFILSIAIMILILKKLNYI